MISKNCNYKSKSILFTQKLWLQPNFNPKVEQNLMKKRFMCKKKQLLHVHDDYLSATATKNIYNLLKLKLYVHIKQNRHKHSISQENMIQVITNRNDLA